MMVVEDKEEAYKMAHSVDKEKAYEMGHVVNDVLDKYNGGESSLDELRERADIYIPSEDIEGDLTSKMVKVNITRLGGDAHSLTEKTLDTNVGEYQRDVIDSINGTWMKTAIREIGKLPIETPSEEE
ncbi:MAG: hypothetical protein ABEK17_01275 [Candidatus Aenigmatarchaeota archaeon]